MDPTLLSTRLELAATQKKKTPNPTENKWIIPKEYYDTLEASASTDFSSFHYQCPMYIGGRDLAGRRIVVILLTHLHQSIGKDTLIKYWINKIDPIKFEDYIVVVNCTLLNDDGDLPLRWNYDLYKALPYAYKKNLKQLIIVKPTWSIKLLLVLSRPFISAKFYRKVEYVNDIKDLINYADPAEVQLPPVFHRPVTSFLSLPDFWNLSLTAQHSLELGSLFIAGAARVIPPNQYIPLIALNLISSLVKTGALSHRLAFMMQGSDAITARIVQTLRYDPLHTIVDDTPTEVLTQLLKAYLTQIPNGILPPPIAQALQRHHSTAASAPTPAPAAPASAPPAGPPQPLSELVNIILPLPRENRGLFLLLLKVMGRVSVDNHMHTGVTPAQAATILAPLVCHAETRAAPRWLVDELETLITHIAVFEQMVKDASEREGNPYGAFPAPLALEDVVTVVDMLAKLLRHTQSPANKNPFLYRSLAPALQSTSSTSSDDGTTAAPTPETRPLYIFSSEEVRRHLNVPPKLMHNVVNRTVSRPGAQQLLVDPTPRPTFAAPAAKAAATPALREVGSSGSGIGGDADMGRPLMGNDTSPMATHGQGKEGIEMFDTPTM